jgi:hypothetical protein
MVDQLAAIFDRLGRAEEHLEAIKGELLGYYNADPCQMSGKYQLDEQGRAGNGEWAVTLAPLGVRLNTLIGEFLHNLRSSLDHLAWQLVLHNGGQPTEGTSFPILKVGPTPDKKGQQRPPYVDGGMSSDALALIEAAQPYKQGAGYASSPLWVLNQLWNIDKHRHVIARGGNIQAHFLGGNVAAFTYTARFDSATEHSAKLVLVPDDPAMDVDAYVTLEVTLHEPQRGIEAPLLPTLEQLLKAVVRMITTAEDRCF